MDADSQSAVPSRELIQTIEALLADKRGEDAASIAKAALANDPQNVRLRTLLAEAQGADRPERQKREMVEELASQLSRMQVATQAAARLEPQKRDALEELASQQLARGRLSDAERTANELIRIAPHWAESYNARGGVLLKRGKLAQAESDFRAALRLAPDEPVYMNNIGLALHRRGKRKEAIGWFEKAATADPTFATARKNLSASTNLYLWGDAFVILFSIAIHVAYAGRDSLRQTGFSARWRRWDPPSQPFQTTRLLLFACLCGGVRGRCCSCTPVRPVRGATRRENHFRLELASLFLGALRLGRCNSRPSGGQS